jgi:hypothetical protein
MTLLNSARHTPFGSPWQAGRPILDGARIAKLGHSARLDLAIEATICGVQLTAIPLQLAATVFRVGVSEIADGRERRGIPKQKRQPRPPSVASCMPVIAAASLEERIRVASTLSSEVLFDLAVRASETDVARPANGNGASAHSPNGRTGADLS